MCELGIFLRVYLPSHPSHPHGALLLHRGSTRTANFFSNLFLFDLIKYSLSRISTLTGAACPSPLAGHTSIYVPSLESIVIFGGQRVTLASDPSDMQMQLFADVWRLNCSNWEWQKIECKGEKLP